VRLVAIAEFAAQRRGDQDDMEKSLFPIVREAVDAFPVQGWYDDLIREATRQYLSVFHTEGGTGDPHPTGAEFAAEIRGALDKTKDPDANSVDRISTWLATAILNAGTSAAAQTDEEFVVMEWVTMHDKDVRVAHKDVEGQQRPPFEPFDVGGEKLRYPGDPSASPSLWMNCRCTLAPVLGSESVTAAADTDKPMVVVALPEQGHAIHGIGEEDKHLTLAYLGKGQDFDREGIHDTVSSLAEKIGEPFDASVNGMATLGEDHAKVLLCESPMIQAARDVLLSEGPVAAAHETSDDQHPHFIPHVTIGYGEDFPPEATDVQSITFDRLAVWDGEDRTEYPVGGTMTDTATEAPVQDDEVAASTEAVPWHGILAPEGVWSGDKRRFAEGSLRFRDLPLPLTWQKVSAGGHDGSVVVGRIDGIERRGNLMAGWGVFLQTPEADEVIGLTAEFGKFGVSIDADDSEFEFDEESSEITFSDARICSAAMVPIPAFSQAFIALGGWPDDEEAMTAAVTFVSDKPWSDFTQADYSDQQWKAACVLHKCAGMEKSCHGLPIKEPGGALNRNGVHAAAARFNQVSAPAEAKARAKSALRGAYKQLGEDPPDVLKAAVILPEAFRRGPGWVTHPRETKRLHDYWTRPGEEGYAKINWGVPGDFNRCRTLVGEEIAENSPDKTRFLNQICAQWHHDALGFWPGRAPTEQHSADAEPAAAVSLVAGGGWCAPSEWFEDPEFDSLTPLTITDDGRVFGHLAGWETCHVGFEDVCVAPPHSASNYAYFLTGEVQTTAGPVPCGNITLGGGHAGRTLRPQAAVAHYDSTSSVVANITCGEDEHGIWVAGCLRPDCDDDTKAALRSCPLSGDWRRIGGEMEMIAALSVPVQGFPVPRVGVKNGTQVALVAAGAVPLAAETTVKVDVDVPAIVDAIEREMSDRSQRRQNMAALAARVGVEQ